MKAAITKKLILDNFTGKTTPLQRKQIDGWLQSKANEELYFKWLEEWETRNPEYQPDSDPLIQGYLDYIHSTPRHAAEATPEAAGSSFRAPLNRSGAIAATIAAIILLSGIWLYGESVLYKTYRTAGSETKTFVLNDGSKVTLAEHSTLKVPRWGFVTPNREVALDGRADFRVSHTRDGRKFVVKTEKNFEVVVLGTEFSVLSRRREAEVVLNRGKVLVNYQEGNAARQLVMKPGELVSFDQHNQAVLKSAPKSPGFSAQGEKRFVFEKTPLSEVALMLRDTYGADVRIDSPNLARRQLMGSFQAEDLDELLSTISDLLNIEAVREENVIRFSEKRSQFVPSKP
ncbi:FecR family protein [Persicitalea sp.]|uniref:FecR family protein n=1 Tax=Persicitalea sp. TaxID=3100273 RepID=UPI00359410DB